MYKVFIQNRPLIFKSVEKNEKISGIVFSSDNIKKRKAEIFTLLENNEINLPIIILCDNPKKTFEVFFKDYDFVEAAGGIVQRKQKFLFIKRNGFWDIPKGKIDFEETPEVAAIREIKEECGIQCTQIENEICITYHTYLYKGKPTLKKTYWYHLLYDGDKGLIAQAEEGITKVKWFKFNKLGKIRKKTFKSIEEVLDSFFIEA